MLDLVILLGLAMAVTALLGLLLAGFVWMPWLIGLLLLGLLVALMRLTRSINPAMDWSLTPEGTFTSGNQAQMPNSTQPVVTSPATAADQTTADQTTADWAAGTAPHGSAQPAAQSDPQPTPTMLYRGAKYRAGDRNQPASPSVVSGKYRGNPWTHS